MGFLTLIDLTCSSSAGSDSRLIRSMSLWTSVFVTSNLYAPFLGGNNFDDSGFHPVLVNLGDERLEAAELVHGLITNRVISKNSI